MNGENKWWVRGLGMEWGAMGGDGAPEIARLPF